MSDATSFLSAPVLANALLTDAVLQSTAIFALGLIAARFLVRQPSRAHALLALAFVAAAATPLATELVRQRGWGLLTPEPAEVAQLASVPQTAIASSVSPSEPRPNSPAVSTIPATGSNGSQVIVQERATLAESPRGNTDRVMSDDNRPKPNQSISQETSSHSMPVNVAAGPEQNEAQFSSSATTDANQTAAATVSHLGADVWRWGVAVLAVIWLVASVTLIARLVRGVLLGRRMLAASEPCTDPSVIAALTNAKRCLGLETLAIDLRQSSELRCPVIWCWGARPRLLVPRSIVGRWSVEQCTGIFCHELAHFKRRDHWAALAAEVVCCLLPWQILAWRAKHSLEQASELACDDWTIAAGHSVTDYAELLLGLVAQGDSSLALAALRRRSGLAGRIHHLLSHAVGRPRLGRLWSLAVLAATLTAVGAVSLCQRGAALADPAPAAEEKPATSTATTKAEAGDAANASGSAEAATKDAATKDAAAQEAQPGEAKSEPSKAAASKSAPAKPETASADSKTASEKTPDLKGNKPAESKGTAPAAMPGKMMGKSTGGAPVPPKAAEGADTLDDHQMRTITVAGQILNEAGQPIAEADLYWELIPRTNDAWRHMPQIVARFKSDAEGRFRAEQELITADYHAGMLVVRAPGHGLWSQRIDWKADKPVEIRLEETYPIDGTIVTPNGEPVKDAKVSLRYLSCSGSGQKDSAKSRPAWHVGLSDEEQGGGTSRDYWPAAVTTDEQGKFHLESMVQMSATVELVVEAAGYAATTVNVAHAESSTYQERTYREPKFTLVLEQPLVVNGSFFDEKTKKPIEGVRVEVEPYNNRRGRMTGSIVRAVTDASGRYSLRTGSAEMYFVKVYPPKNYPGISNSFSAQEIQRLAGKSRTITYPLRLRPGVMVSGRVVDESTGEGVGGAQVSYHPTKDRKLGTNSEFWPVTTAEDGSFELTTADGVGFLMVEAAGKGFYRQITNDERLALYRGPKRPHGLLEIDVPAEGSPEPLTINLKRGKELVLNVLDPAGEPVKSLRTACDEQSIDGFYSGESVNGNRYRLNAVEPGRTYRVFLFSAEAKAGKVAEVVVPEDGKPIDVTLEPCATIRGRYIYEGGAPAVEVTNFSHFVSHPEKSPKDDNFIFNMPYYDNFVGSDSGKRTTDEEGNFELANIVPGITFYLHLNYNFGDGKNYRDMGKLAPGEVRELGDIMIQSR